MKRSGKHEGKPVIKLPDGDFRVEVFNLTALTVALRSSTMYSYVLKKGTYKSQS